MKIVIDLPEEVTEWFKERAFIPIKYYTEVERAMEKAEPLSEILDKLEHISEKAEAYYDGAINGWKQGRKAMIDDVMCVFDDFMCGEVDEDGTETFLEMLKDRIEREGENDT